MSTKGRAYIAGPMRGKADHNFPAFKAAAEDLRAQGWQVTSPHELDEQEGFDPSNGVTAEQYAHFLARDIQTLSRGIDTLFLLPGWEDSPGARAEFAYAQAIGLDILAYGTEERVVNPRTGGAKGRKAERYELVPWPAMGAVARVYAHGARKYDEWNWLRGYAWSLSIGAAFRHLAAFTAGEDNDPESGLPHPAHVVFHMLALITFMRLHPDLDDREAS